MTEMPPAFDRVSGALSGAYRVERELGRGGMATVYLAEDLKHHRPVAVKVLHPELAAALGHERFLREIELAANLQHPHLLPLFDSGEAAGLLYYVMPYIAGETLRARLARDRQLPVDEAVGLAREVASALSYAHGRGVIHRDVKPENVLLQGGHALVADFGIALAVQRAGEARMTQSGLSLGTPQYMAPEQAAGDKAIDPRADVYALGCVLYEMLAGEPPFTGPSAPAIIARVLTEDPPPLATRRRSVPAHVSAAVHTALERLPADRFNGVDAFAAALAAPVVAAPGVGPERLTPRSPRQPRSSPRKTAWVAGAALIVGAALGWVAGVMRTRASAVALPGGPSRAASRFIIDIDSGSLGATGTAISPDGRTVVYAREGPDGTRLYARTLGDLRAQPIRGTENGEYPFFSPNGEWLAFYSNGAVRKVRLLPNSTPVLVSEVRDAAQFGGGAWVDGDTIIYAVVPGGTLYRVSANGGTPSRVTVAAARRILNPQPLPGGRAILVTTKGDDFGASKVGVVDLSTGSLREFAAGSGAQYAAGYVLYVGATSVLFRHPFDTVRHEAMGKPDEIANGLDELNKQKAPFAASRAGTVVYHASRGSWALTFTDTAGRQLRALPLDRPWSPRFSPDGGRVAYGAQPPGREKSEVWIAELESGAPQRLTTDENNSGDPQWSNDKKRLAYWTDAPGGSDLVVQALDGGPRQTLTSRPGHQWPSDWVRDGALLFTDVTWAGEMAIWVQPADGTPARPYLETPARETGARASPDGHWVAYTSDESGENEAYVQSYPTPMPSRKRRISRNGGLSPVWRGDGREIYYWRAGQLFAARVEPGSPDEPLTVRAPRPLFRAPYVENVHANYDVSPDGRQFVIVTREAHASRLVVALDLVGAPATQPAAP